MAKNPFKAAMTANRGLAKAINKDRRTDFRMTQSGLSALTQNLLTTQGSLGRQLTRTNAKGLAAMGRIADRGNARTTALVSNGQAKAENLFGSVVGSDTELWRGSNRVAKSQARVSKGAMKAGELQSRGANEAMDILQTAATAAAASGKYELGEALMYRAKDDAEVIEARRAEVAAQRLQYNLEVKQAKELARFEQRMTEKANEEGTGEQYQEAAGMLNSYMVDPGTTLQGATNMAYRISSQYNLGPEASARLQAQVVGAYDPETGKSMVAPVQLDEAGNPIQSTIGDDDKSIIKSSLLTALNGSDGTPPTKAEFVASVLAVPEGVDPLPQSIQAQLQDYAEMLYDAVVPTYEAVGESMRASEAGPPSSKEDPTQGSEYTLSDNPYNRFDNLDIVRKWRSNEVSIAEAKRRLEAAGITEWGWTLSESGYNLNDLKK